MFEATRRRPWQECQEVVFACRVPFFMQGRGDLPGTAGARVGKGADTSRRMGCQRAIVSGSGDIPRIAFAGRAGSCCRKPWSAGRSLHHPARQKCFKVVVQPAGRQEFHPLIRQAVSPNPEKSGHAKQIRKAPELSFEYVEPAIRAEIGTARKKLPRLGRWNGWDTLPLA